MCLINRNTYSVKHTAKQQNSSKNTLLAFDYFPQKYFAFLFQGRLFSCDFLRFFAHAATRVLGCKKTRNTQYMFDKPQNVFGKTHCKTAKLFKKYAACVRLFPSKNFAFLF